MLHRFYINQTYIYRIHISCEENPKADKNKCHNKTAEWRNINRWMMRQNRFHARIAPSLLNPSYFLMRTHTKKKKKKQQQQLKWKCAREFQPTNWRSKWYGVLLLISYVFTIPFLITVSICDSSKAFEQFFFLSWTERKDEFYFYRRICCISYMWK